MVYRNQLHTKKLGIIYCTTAQRRENTVIKYYPTSGEIPRISAVSFDRPAGKIEREQLQLIKVYKGRFSSLRERKQI